MILRAPTGLYANVIPTGESPGNITFTISTQLPPRDSVLALKIPTGLIAPNLEQTVYSRAVYGELIYTVTSSARSNTGNNIKQFETGEILEFDAPPLTVDVDPMLVNPQSQQIHNLNYIDFLALGLDAADVAAIGSAATESSQKLIKELNSYRQLRMDADQEISSAQKQINDIGRAITALKATEDDSISAVIDTLTAKSLAANARRDAALANANRYAALAQTIQDRLNSISVVVK